jgi:hypothetical protein
MIRMIAGGLISVFAALLQLQAQAQPVSLRPGYQLSGSLFTFGLIAVGSQYFNEEWQQGNVVLTTGAEINSQLLRYHGYLDELIWLPSTARQPVKLDKGLIRSFAIQMPGMSEPMVFENSTNTPDLEAYGMSFFAQRLFSGAFELLVHRQIVQDGKTVKRSGNKVFHLPILKYRPIYYFLLPGNEVHTMGKLRHRAFVNAFPGRQSEIRDVLRSKHIRIRSEADLIQAAEAVDTLFGD